MRFSVAVYRALSSLTMWSSASLSAHVPVVGSVALRICDVKSDLYFASNSLHAFTRLSASTSSTIAEKAR